MRGDEGCKSIHPNTGWNADTRPPATSLPGHFPFKTRLGHSLIQSPPSVMATLFLPELKLMQIFSGIFKKSFNPATLLIRTARFSRPFGGRISGVSLYSRHTLISFDVYSRHEMLLFKHCMSYWIPAANEIPFEVLNNLPVSLRPIYRVVRMLQILECGDLLTLSKIN